LGQQIAELERLALGGDARAIIALLSEIVPTFQPDRSSEILWVDSNGTTPALEEWWSA
jgi:hypothetical protein